MAELVPLCKCNCKVCVCGHCPDHELPFGAPACEESEHALKPIDEVEALFNARANHIAELEDAAQVLSAQVSGPRPRARMTHARSLAETELSPLIETLISEQPEMDGPLAEARVRHALINYAASAMVMPMSEFATRADTLRYDIDALAEVFSTDIESVSLTFCRNASATSSNRM